MKIVRTVSRMHRLAREWRKQARRIGFVPTMGYLHEGHLRLVREARRQVGIQGVVALSIYVNPTQFGPDEDLSQYPRDFRRDARLCRAAGVDCIFAPPDSVMYPRRDQGGYSSYVIEECLSQGMEGASRPSHFRGVTTVVAKLFHCVQPDIAVFGAKDWQQAAVVRRMAADLNFPLRIVVVPTHRERDGLAMSSRNAYLSPSERSQATILWRAILAARREVRGSKRGLPVVRLRNRILKLLESQPDARVDYIAFFDPNTLVPVKTVRPGIRLALAVFIGRTRLIDNASL